MAVVAAAFLCFGSDASAQKTTKLFNGKDLSGWNFVVDKNSVPAEQVYSVKTVSSTSQDSHSDTCTRKKIRRL